MVSSDTTTLIPSRDSIVRGTSPPTAVSIHLSPSGGTVRMGHISKQSNRLLRHLLVEAAHRAVHRKGDPDLRSFYFRLMERKKIAAVASTAVARKLVLRFYRMLREDIDYTEFRRRGREARCVFMGLKCPNR
jgi:Transposase IS116/IS110/IS902 family